MKKLFKLIILFIVLIPFSVFAKGLKVEYLIPEYDTKQRIVINTTNNSLMFNTTFGLSNQEIKFRVLISNTDDVDYYITNINISSELQSYFKYSIDGLKVNDLIKSNEKKEIYVVINSSETNTEIDDELKISINYDIKPKNIPPDNKDPQNESPNKISENPQTGIFSYAGIIICFGAILLFVRFKLNNRKVFKTFVVIGIPLVLIGTIGYSYSMRSIDEKPIKEENQLLSITGNVSFRNFERIDGKSATKEDSNEKFDIYSLEINLDGGNVKGYKDTINVNVFKDTAFYLYGVKKNNYKLKNWIYNGTQKNFVNNLIVLNENAKLKPNWEYGPYYYLNIDLKGGHFNNNYIDFVSLKENETYTLEEPYRNNYKFNRWMDSNDENRIIDNEISMGTEDINIYADWCILNGEEHEILLDPNANKHIEGTTITRVNGDEYDLETPDNPGYKFLGWYTNPVNGKHILSKDCVNLSGTQVLYAHWEPNKYKVTFDYGIGIGTETERTITYDETYGKLPDVQVTGYHLIGWYLEDTFDTEVNEDTIYEIPNNSTLYAKLEANNYTIKFNANGGIDIDDVIEVTYDGTYKNLPIPEKEGYEFLGWFTEEIGGDKIIEGVTKVNEITNFYAHWKANTDTPYLVKHYFMNLDMETYTLFEEVINYGTTDTEIDAPILSEDKYIGFEKPESKKIYILSSGDSVTEYYYERKTPIISFDANSGEVNTLSGSGIYKGKYGYLPTPTRIGYTFIGWYTEPDGGTLITSETLITEENNHTIYAHWEANTDTPYKIKHCLLTLNDEIDENACYIENKTGKSDAYYLIEPLSYIGYQTPDTDAKQIAADGSSTFTIKYFRKKILVTFDANTNGGTTSFESKYVKFGDEIGTLPTVQKQGYTFTGWYTASSSGNKVIETNTMTGDTPITYYAQFIPNNNTNFKVNHWFQKVGGNASQHNTSNYELIDTEYVQKTTDTSYTPSVKDTTNDAYKGFTAPTPTVFNINADGKGEANYYYIRNTYPLTISKGTGIDKVYVNNKEVTNSFITLEYHAPVNITYTLKTGYSFEKIVGDYQTLNFSMENRSRTIYLTTTANTYTLNAVINSSYATINASSGWSINSNKINASKAVTYDGTYGTLPSVAVSSGYTFKGWYLDSSYSTEVKTDTTVKTAGTHTIYAKIIANTYQVTLNNQGASTAGSTVLTATMGSGLANITVPAKSIKITLNRNYIATGATTAVMEYAYANFVFNGYYTEANGKGTQYITNTGASARAWNIASNTTLYAYWTGGTIASLPTPTRSGYSFLGWYTSDGTLVTTSTVFSSETTIYANWKANSYEATKTTYAPSFVCSNDRILTGENCIYRYNSNASKCGSEEQECNCRDEPKWYCDNQGYDSSGNWVCNGQWVEYSERVCDTCTVAKSCIITENQYRSQKCNGNDKLSSGTCIKYTCPSGGTLSGTTCVFN